MMTMQFRGRAKMTNSPTNSPRSQEARDAEIDRLRALLNATSANARNKDASARKARREARALEARALKVEALLEVAVKGLETEFDYHERLWDLSMDAAREATACGTKADEHEAMQRASAHSKRMDAIGQTLTAIREKTS